MTTEGMRVIVADASDDPDSQPPVPWWSFSKTILAAAALALVDRGKLHLDAPNPGAPYVLRQLLQHTSGLTDYGLFPEYHRAVAAGEPPWTVDELLHRTNASTLLFAPDTRFSYSNIGYLFVRQAIERATGSSLGDALARVVFEPLEIEGVFVADAPRDLDATAWGNAQRYDPRWVYHGCLVGSLPRAAACLHRLLHGRLLAPATAAAMRLPYSYDAGESAPPDFGYGLGLMIEPVRPGEHMAGHAGGGPGSTIAVFSAMNARRTLAAAADTDAALIDHVRGLIS